MDTMKQGFVALLAGLGIIFILLIAAGAGHTADVFNSTKDTPAHLLPSRSSTTVEQPTTWTGIWAAALTGYSMSNTELTLDHFHKGDRETAGFLDGIGGEGWDATVQAGVNYQIGRIVVGGFGEYQFGGPESSVGAYGDRLSVEQKDGYGLFGLVGVPNGDTLFYGAAGYVWGEAELSAPGYKHTFDIEGPAAELGIVHKFTPNIALKASARYTWLDEQKYWLWGDADCGERLTIDPGVWSAKAGLVIATDGLGFGLFGSN